MRSCRSASACRWHLALIRDAAVEAVTIRDLRDVEGGSVLAFDLFDLLRLAEAEVRASTWRCRFVECVDTLAEELYRLSDGGTSVSGDEMLRLAAGVDQVIDGDFEASRPGHDRPWLIVRAIDRLLYVVASEDRAFLDRVPGRFRDVRQAPDERGDLA